MATRIAARDMRASVRGLWLLAIGVFIGVGAVALVGTASQSLVNGARQGALESVGGDLSLRLFHRPPSEAELQTIRLEGDVTITAELRVMARAVQAQSVPALIELKGIDNRYPLYGEVKVRPEQDIHQLLAMQNGIYGAVVDSALLDALGVAVGDGLKIGNAQYQLRGVLESEPDRAFRAFTLGPRVMVAGESLPLTGVADIGSEIYFYTRIKLNQTSDTEAQAKAAMARIDQAFSDAGWRMVNAHQGVPGVERTLAIAHVLLLFIGLGVMLIGGGGISGAVRAHVLEKMETIAILKSIGASPRSVILAIGFEVLSVAAVGSVLGVAFGALGPVMVANALGDQLPFALETVPDAKPLLVAGVFGVLVAALYAWWPLMGVRDMNARILLRERFMAAPHHYGARGWMGAVMILSALMATVFWASPMPLMTVGFLIGALFLALFYFALGVGLSRVAKFIATGKRASVRLALGNLYRVGAPTGPVVMALGLTLTLWVALDGIGSAAGRHVGNTLPDRAPDVVSFSIKPELVGQFKSALSASNLVAKQKFMPFLHARIQAIGGVAVQRLAIPSSMNWVVRGDRGVSFARHLAGNAQWNTLASDQTGFAVDANVAKKLNLKIGDHLTLNVGGVVRTAPVLTLMDIDWTGLDLDFPIIATPATFADIPYTYAATFKAQSGKAAALEAFIKHRFADIPLIRISDVLRALTDALQAVVAGLKTAAWMCGLAALVVLAGSVLQGLRARSMDAVLFKVLGARRRQLLAQLSVEFLSLGLLVAITAVPLGLVVAGGVARAAGLDAVGVPWLDGVGLAGIAVLVTWAVGMLATFGAYGIAPAQILRARRP